MKIAIVGGHKLKNPSVVADRVYKFVRGLAEDTVVVSGAAPGVDSFAAAAAHACGLVVVEYPADWRPNGKLDRSAGFKRNQLIVDQADVVHAFWDRKSPGTADTIARARKAHKPVTIHEV